jgi:hypothetical protein
LLPAVTMTAVTSMMIGITSTPAPGLLTDFSLTAGSRFRGGTNVLLAPGPNGYAARALPPSQVF